jgi:hypothetical protein
MNRKELQIIGIAAMEYQLKIHKPNEIMFNSLQPDKNICTYQEYYDAMVNDTPLDGLKQNQTPVDDIIRMNNWYLEKYNREITIDDLTRNVERPNLH